MILCITRPAPTEHHEHDHEHRRPTVGDQGRQQPNGSAHVNGRGEDLMRDRPNAERSEEAICTNAFAIDESAPWRDQLTSDLRQFHALLLAHRDAATLLRERPPDPRRLDHIETTVRILLDAGFTPDDAAGISRRLSAHVLDSVPAREPGPPGPSSRKWRTTRTSPASPRPSAACRTPTCSNWA